MTSTKRDLDQIHPLSDKCLRIIEHLAPLIGPPLRLLWRIGPIGRWLNRTTGGRAGAIGRHAKRGEYDKAAEIAIEALKESRDLPDSKWPSQRDVWWFFMYEAAENVFASGNYRKMPELVEMARDGVQPFKGYAVARAYLAFSRWKFKVGDFDQAFAFANDAALADPTWAEPDFVLGWYCLAMEAGDAVPHLAEAVRKDSEVLRRIKKDPLCLKNPQVIGRLKAREAG